MEQREEEVQHARVRTIDISQLQSDWAKHTYIEGELRSAVVDGKECKMDIADILDIVCVDYLGDLAHRDDFERQCNVIELLKSRYAQSIPNEKLIEVLNSSDEGAEGHSLLERMAFIMPKGVLRYVLEMGWGRATEDLLRQLVLYMDIPSFNGWSIERKVEVFTRFVELNESLAISLIIESIYTPLASCERWVELYHKNTAHVECSDVEKFCRECEGYFILKEFYGGALYEITEKLSIVARNLAALDKEVYDELQWMRAPGYVFNTNSKALFYAICFNARDYLKRYHEIAYKNHLVKNIEVSLVAGVLKSPEFMELIQDGNAKCVELYIKWGMEIKDEHITCALRFSREKVLQLLLEYSSKNIDAFPPYKKQAAKAITLADLVCLKEQASRACSKGLLYEIIREALRVDEESTCYLLARAKTWDESMHKVFRDIRNEKRAIAAVKMAQLISELKMLFSFALDVKGMAERGMRVLQKGMATHLAREVKIRLSIEHEDLFVGDGLDAIIWIICHVSRFGFKESDAILLQSMRFAEFETFSVLLNMYMPSPQVLLHAVRCDQGNFIQEILKKHKVSTALLKVSIKLAQEYDNHNIAQDLSSELQKSLSGMPNLECKNPPIAELNARAVITSIWRDDLIIKESVLDGVKENIVTRINRVALCDVVNKLAKLHYIAKDWYDLVFEGIMTSVALVINSHIKEKESHSKPGPIPEAFNVKACFKKIILNESCLPDAVRSSGAKHDIGDVLKGVGGNEIEESALRALEYLISRPDITRSKWRTRFYTMCCLISSLPEKAVSLLKVELPSPTSLRSNVEHMFPEFAAIGRANSMTQRLSIEQVVMGFQEK